MFLGAVRLHLRMYTKFPRPRNRFHFANTNKQRSTQYAAVRGPRTILVSQASSFFLAHSDAWVCGAIVATDALPLNNGIARRLDRS
jgi:hypothetical protein